ncbi:Gfo/Idh/MocA family oxidoreductase [Chelativorans sp. SCAU2101]|uniref:Gfo/Idh/MocA family oxidoreductase n=1 Tax=Chelativorans petroleitrophicus TaxID=2975484 RepID=A0A9X2X5H5_9HYPH|nr:Gfo/Idh/MocA family oxidoreductase [Chelativorans petroleitrophicus]
MPDKVKILVVGLGNMGVSHAKAYHKLDGFEIVGLMSRTIKSHELPEPISGYPRFENFEEALAETKPDAVSINTWPNTHAEYALKAIEAGCHVFMEKPLATNIEDAEKVVAAARAENRKLVLGYILRVHPSWMKFIEVGRTLGKPLVMRLNLNQQSSGPAWHWHKNLIDSLIPIVDCGVHYVDVMCQLTGAKPVRVHGIGAKLWAEAAQQNYGHLHVTFDDGSVGWYEAGWGPMMSEIAYFVKDVVGPKGAVSIVAGQQERSDRATDELSDSADIDQHTKTDAIKIHYAEVDENKNFVRKDEILNMKDEPDHQELCNREQEFFLRAIREDLDLSESMEAAVNSLRIVLAAERSIKEGRAINL